MDYKLTYQLSPKFEVASKRKYSTNSSDEVLLHACRARDRSAQKYLYEKYYGKLLPIGLRYLRNENESQDAVQTTFIKVFNAIGNNTVPIKFDSWVAKIMVNNCLDKIRSRNRFNSIHSSNIDIEVPLDPSIIQEISVNELMDLVKQLDERQCIVFSLAVVEGYRHLEIGHLLSISEGTSRWYLNQAKKNLKKMIQKLNIR